MRIFALAGLLALLLSSLVSAETPDEIVRWAKPKLYYEIVARTERGLYLAFEEEGKRSDAGIDNRKIEAFIDAVALRLGIEYRRNFVYGVIPKHIRFTSSSGRGFPSGIVFPGEPPIVYSPKQFDSHELAHLVIRELRQPPSPGIFWHEGLAIVLSGKPAFNAKRAKAEAREVGGLAVVVNKVPNNNGQYHNIAGAFMDFLIKRYGLPNVVRFFRETAEPREYQKAFRKVFGQSLSGAEQEWLK